MLSFKMARMVFNLDNPWLSSYYYLLPPSPSDEITCSFLAYPVPDPIAQPGDLSRFGSIISETPERLEIRLTAYELERMHELKQAWVSKYAEEKMICYLRLGSLEPDFSRSLVFQQGYKIPQVSQQADTAANPTLPAISNAPRLLEPVDLEQVGGPGFEVFNLLIIVTNVKSGAGREGSRKAHRGPRRERGRRASPRAG